jgi:hypothetical protein
MAAAVSFAAVVVIGALWPTSQTSVTVAIRVTQIADPTAPAEDAAAGRPAGGTDAPHPLVGLGGAMVVALRGTTLERVASGALDPAGKASLRLRPEPYLVCVTLPVPLHPVPQVGGPASALVSSPAGNRDWLCQPVTVEKRPQAPITLTVAAGGAA